MRIGVIPDNIVERIMLAAGKAPEGLAESWITFHLARTILVATRLGIFDAIHGGASTVEEISAECGTDRAATRHLLVALEGSRFVQSRGEQYSLAAKARLLCADHPHSFRDKVLLQFLEWDWLSHLEEYVRCGQPLDGHATLSGDEWGIYQRGMRSGIEPMALEVARRLRLPANPRRMLDIGGSHGFYSVCLCRRHPTMSAEVLDLPEAVVHAIPLLAREGLGDRIVHRPGDVLHTDLGEERYDLIWIGNLVHHFDGPTNQELVRRCARALRCGGVLALYDTFRIRQGDRVSQIGGIFGLFCAMGSRSDTWTPEEMADWQSEAGLHPRRPFRLSMVRDIGVQAADKST